MPRLSSKYYLATRHALRTSSRWRSTLDVDDLLAVNRFFAPTKLFTDEEALAHRRAVTAADRSLPNRVGKILRKRPLTATELSVAEASGVPLPSPVTIGRPGREQRLVVHGVLRPEIDLRKLARTIEQDMRKPVGERAIDRLARDQDEAA